MYEFDAVDGVEGGDRLTLENLDNGEISSLVLDERGRFRLSVASDALDGHINEERPDSKWRKMTPKCFQMVPKISPRRVLVRSMASDTNKIRENR